MRGQARLDLGAGKAIGHAVEVIIELDVVIDADATQAPLGQNIGFARQGLEVWPIKLFEQLAAGGAEPAQHPLVIELLQQVTDRTVHLGHTIKPAMAQASEQPALDNQHAGLDFGLVARPPRTGRQDRALVMRCHLGIAAVDLRLVKAGLDDGDFGVVRQEGQRRSPRRLVAPIQSPSPWVQLASA